jgi:hypothetical protein
MLGPTLQWPELWRLGHFGQFMLRDPVHELRRRRFWLRELRRSVSERRLVLVLLCQWARPTGGHRDSPTERENEWLAWDLQSKRVVAVEMPRLLWFWWVQDIPQRRRVVLTKRLRRAGPVIVAIALSPMFVVAGVMSDKSGIAAALVGLAIITGFAKTTTA